MHLIFQQSDAWITYSTPWVTVLANFFCAVDLEILIKTQQQQLSCINLATIVANTQLICIIYLLEITS